MKSVKTVRIVSDGTPNNTHVYLGDTEISGISEIVWKINSTNFAEAVLTFPVVCVDVLANAELDDIK